MTVGSVLSGFRQIFVPKHYNRLALLVASNYDKSQFALRGCLNDMQMLEDKLTSLGVDGIVKLLGTDMTTSNWLDAMRGHAAKLSVNTIGFHGHSHHGSRHGASEVWCPDDFDGTEAKMIQDKQTRDILKTVKGRWVDWADCCHAADSIRAITFKDEKLKFIPEDRSPILVSAIGQMISSIADTVVDPEYATNCLQLAACRSDQTSADAKIDGKYCGAFTFYGLRAWDAKATYGSIIDKSKALLSRNGYAQSPEYCGSANNADGRMLT
jgi:hypothetical protein